MAYGKKAVTVYISNTSLSFHSSPPKKEVLGNATGLLNPMINKTVLGSKEVSFNQVKRTSETEEANSC